MKKSQDRYYTWHQYHVHLCWYPLVPERRPSSFLKVDFSDGLYSWSELFDFRKRGEFNRLYDRMKEVEGRFKKAYYRELGYTNENR